MGRNRRYYRITQKGIMALEAYKEEWENYKKNIDNIMLNGGAQ
jgi:PadR family transcriptional regulator PadR